MADDLQQLPKNKLEYKYILALVITLGIVGFSLWQVLAVRRTSPVSPPPPPLAPVFSSAPQPRGVGGDIYSSLDDRVSQQLPATNPFSQETNPIKQTYHNPFE